MAPDPLHYGRPVAHRRDVVVLGAGGHALVCIETLRAAGYDIAGCVSSDGTATADIDAVGVTMIGGEDDLADIVAERHPQWFVAIGDNQARRRAFEAVIAAGGTVVRAISPDARVSPSAHAEPGVLVMPGSVVNALATLGRGAIVNSGAVVDHECEVGAFAHIAPAAALAGGVTVGDGSLVGIGATVTPGRDVGAWTVVGAGAVVVADVGDSETVAGVPARSLHPTAVDTDAGPVRSGPPPSGVGERGHQPWSAPASARAASILVVCTGNLCRSPLVEALLRDGLRRAGVEAIVRSAGLAAPLDQPPDDKLLRVAEELGVGDTVRDHRSRQLTADDLATADLVIAMTAQHRREIEHMARAPVSVGTLRGVAWRADVMAGRPVEVGQWISRLTADLPDGGADDVPGDIDDPIGGRLRHYRTMGDEVNELVRALVDSWSGR